MKKHLVFGLYFDGRPFVATGRSDKGNMEHVAMTTAAHYGLLMAAAEPWETEEELQEMCCTRAKIFKLDEKDLWRHISSNLNKIDYCRRINK